MKMSSFRVRTRLIAGFALLLLMTAFIGVLGVSELSKLNHTVEQLATSDWETARTAISLRSNIRSIAARTAEFLLADAAARPGVRSKMEENRAAIEESLQKMSTLDTDSAEAVEGLRSGAGEGLEQVVLPLIETQGRARRREAMRAGGARLEDEAPIQWVVDSGCAHVTVGRHPHPGTRLGRSPSDRACLLEQKHGCPALRGHDSRGEARGAAPDDDDVGFG